MYPIDQECILTKPDRFSKTDCAHKSIKPLPQKELETQRRLYRTRLLQITMDGQTSRMMRPSWSTMFYQWSRSTRSWKTPRLWMTRLQIVLLLLSQEREDGSSEDEGDR